MTEVANKKVEVKDELALRTLSHKYEANQLGWLHMLKLESGYAFQMSFDPTMKDFEHTVESFPVIVETEEPSSKFYATSVSNAGLLDRKAYPTKQYQGIVKQIDTDKGVNYEFVDTLVHDARGIEVTIKGIEYTGSFVFSIKEEEIPADAEKFSVFNVDSNLFTLWEPSYATSSQTRKGELVAKRSSVSYYDYFNKIGFDIRAFESEKDGRVTIKDINKMSKRVKQTASSSRPRDFFKDYILESIYDVEMDNMGQKEMVKKLVFFNNKNTDKEARILIIPGFFVKRQVETIVPNFSNDTIKMTQANKTIVKDAIDGAHLIDKQFAINNGFADKDGIIKSGEQFRWGQAIKGLFIVIEGLHKALGVDIVLAEGGIKGSPIQGFKDGNMDFAVLNRVREDEVNPTLNLSRQVVSYNQNENLIKGLEEDTKELMDKVLSYDDDAIRDFLSIKEFDIESEEAIDVDQLTTKLYSIGKNTFMKSHTMKKKLSDLLKSSLQKFSNGASLYLKEAAFKHMAVDPYAIIHYLSKGIIGIDAATISEKDRIGIKPKHVVVSQKVLDENGEEVFQLNLEKGYAFRFPFLHENEGRILNEDKDLFYDSKTKSFYEEEASKGNIQGLIFYSLWDNEPEGQSGADYDGDQSGYTTNKHVVDNIESQPLFLDYSLVDGELVSGCPFTGPGRDLTEFLTTKEQEYVKANDIIIEKGGISAPAELSNTKEWVNLVGKLGAYLARRTLEGNEIGRFTNISLSISQIISDLENFLDSIAGNKNLTPVYTALHEEIIGYRNLNYFLAVAIRWEVDKAKHGGAYFDKMPFLTALLDTPVVSEVVELEKQYNISLQRLIYGSKIV